MSSFHATAFNPDTKRYDESRWVDNHFGPHRYGITFDGKIWWTEDDLQVAIAQTIDDTPVDEEWLRKVGFRADADLAWSLRWMVVQITSEGPRLRLDAGNWCKPNATRGDVIRLATGLGITLRDAT